MPTTAKLRHWKQQFSPDAQFVWRKEVIYLGEKVELGDAVPAGIARNKLRAMWDARIIELAPDEEWSDKKRRAAAKKKVKVKQFTPNELDYKPHGLFDHSLGLFVLQPAGPEVKIEETGGGWFKVTVGDGKPKKIQGRDNVDRYVESIE